MYSYRLTSTGYSWKTNQYGLTIDNLSGYELVLPNGTVTTVTESSSPDLFWGLKGGYNNFVSTVLQLPCANEYAYLRMVL